MKELAATRESNGKTPLNYMHRDDEFIPTRQSLLSRLKDWEDWASWQEFFHTSDRAKVEETCRAAGSEFEWRTDGGLRIINRTRGIAKHPRSNEDIFFNQVQIHHIYCVDEETREGLRALFDESDLPRNVYYGDGSPIPDEVMQHLGEVFEKVAVRFQWQKGDMIMCDNMLVMHARDTFEGPRQIVVAMGQMMSADRMPA